MSFSPASLLLHPALLWTPDALPSGWAVLVEDCRIADVAAQAMFNFHVKVPP